LGTRRGELGFFAILNVKSTNTVDAVEKMGVVSGTRHGITREEQSVTEKSDDLGRDFDVEAPGRSPKAGRDAADTAGKMKINTV
jgi:hypothetical protein